MLRAVDVVFVVDTDVRGWVVGKKDQHGMGVEGLPMSVLLVVGLDR